jgi:hypothetical protein
MTISTTSSRISYNGNSVTTVFAFPYRFLANIDVVVVEVSALGVEVVKTLTTHYTITGAGDDAGGSVTMLVAPATGVTLLIYRNTDIVQETDYVTGDSFPAETHERTIDRLTMICQEIVNGTGGGGNATRSIKIPIGDPENTVTELPPAVSRLDRFLTFNSITGGVEVSDVTVSQVEVFVEELGLTETTVNVFTKNQSVLPVALTPGTTVAVDASLSNNFTLTPVQNFTLSNPTNLTDGMVLNLRFKQDATGSRVVTWGSKYKFPGGTAGVLSTAAAAVDFMSCYYDLTSDTLDCVLNKAFA